MTRSILFAALAVVLPAALGIWWMVGRAPDAGDGDDAGVSFVAPETCYQCHEAQRRDWHGSHHHMAMDVATPETVLGDFDDATFAHGGLTSRFFRKGDGYAVETDGPDGTLTTYDIEYVFGVDPLQQYLVTMPDGRVQCLLQAWDTRRNRWFFLYDEAIPHTDELHWTGRAQNWNFMCAECHTTNLQRGYDVEDDVYRTTFDAINVGCQACHGPGSAHVEWARAHAGATEYAPDDPKGLEVRLKDPNPDVQVDHCARCHSRRVHVTPEYHYGDRFLDHYDLQLLIEPYYFVDGQIHDEVYVYGSFLQTKKQRAGVRCTDCHDPHTASLKREGNALCVHCHQESPPDRFPTLKKKRYDTPDHHFHTQGTAGAFCVDCHMPERTYMQVDPRRDHSFRVPRPDLSVTLGTPNACNGCHEDKDADWAAAEVEAWYPDSPRRARPHFGELLQHATVQDPRIPPRLVAVIGDDSMAGIVRATAVHHLRHHDGPLVQMALQRALEDDEPLVRAAALESMTALQDRRRGRAPPELRVQLAEAIGPLLSDPVRVVRAEAAAAMARAVGKDVPVAFLGPMARARAEYVARQEALRDRPDGPFNLGVLHEHEGDLDAAERSYGEAIRRFPDFVPARVNRAMLRNGRGRNREALEDFEALTEARPEFGEGWYSKGLLLAEMGRKAAAVEALREAARLLPERGRIHYNLGALLDGLEQHEEAERAYLGSLAAAPGSPQTIDALVNLYVRTERWDDAEQLVEARLGQAASPEEAAALKQLLRRIREQARDR